MPAGTSPTLLELCSDVSWKPPWIRGHQFLLVSFNLLCSYFWLVLIGWCELLSTSGLTRPQCLQSLSLWTCVALSTAPWITLSVVTSHCGHPAFPHWAFLGWKTLSWCAVDRSL